MNIESNGVMIKLDKEETEAIMQLIGKLDIKNAKKIFGLTENQFNKLAGIHMGILKYSGEIRA